MSDLFETDWERGCVYPLFWRPLYIAYVPRGFLAVALGAGIFAYNISSWFVMSLFAAPIGFVVFGLLYLYGFFKVRREPFYFSILYNKYKTIKRTKLAKERGGNIYFS
ncbi:MAG: hypothetical protein KKB70_07925 [Proteobacteria bacterium]|nr:hypothetical protein [Pseudomonadota bacterium]